LFTMKGVVVIMISKKTFGHRNAPVLPCIVLHSNENLSSWTDT